MKGLLILHAICHSIGRINLPDDMEKVQKLLKKVPPTECGPTVNLVVDRICGSKTIEAIHKFQLHHFGWKGADGRVDPYGTTIANLMNTTFLTKKSACFRSRGS